MHKPELIHLFIDLAVSATGLTTGFFMQNISFGCSAFAYTATGIYFLIRIYRSLNEKPKTKTK